MNVQYFLSLLFSLICISILSAQTAPTWVRTIEISTSSYVIFHTIETSNGGVLLVGSSADEMGARRSYAHLLDLHGNTIFERTYPSDHLRDRFNSVVEFEDGKFMLFGTHEFGEVNDFLRGELFLLEINATGEPVRDKVVMTDEFLLQSVGIVKAENGFVISFRRCIGRGNWCGRNAYFRKVTVDGLTIWETESVGEDFSGGFNYNILNVQDSLYFALTLDGIVAVKENGALHPFTGDEDHFVRYLGANASGNLLTVGFLDYYGTKIFREVSADSETIFSFEERPWTEEVYSVFMGETGQYCYFSKQDNATGQIDFKCINTNGQVVKSQFFRKEQERNVVRHILQTKDGGYVMLINTEGIMLVYRIDRNGNIFLTNSNNYDGNHLSVKISPQPITDNVRFTFSNLPRESVSLEIYGASGYLIDVQHVDNHSFKWDRGTLPSGLYFYKIQTKNGLMDSGKLILK